MAETLADPPAEVPAAPRRGRGRSAASLLLIVLAAVSLLVGGVLLYVREEIVDNSAFSQRAVDAVHQPAVQRVIAKEIAVQVIEPSLPDVLAARPAIITALRLIIRSDAFTPAVRFAAAQGHRLLFERGAGNAVFTLADAGTLVSSALHNLAPGIAKQIPKGAETIMVKLRKRSFADATLRAADTVRTLGFVLPVVAIVLFAAAIALDPRRRRAITRSAVAVGVLGIAFALTYELFRRYLLAHVYGSQELTNTDVRGALGALWGAYLGDLMTWTLAATATAWLFAAAASSLVPAYSARESLDRVGELLRRPLPPRGRALRGGALVILGLFAIIKPTLVMRLAGVAGGALVAYFGAGELLSAVAPAERRVRRLRRPEPRRALAMAAVFGTCLAVLIFLAAFTGATRNSRAGGITACNGYPQLCARRLDQVAFAGTHNSMSAADTSGWLIANQGRALSEQLDDGIRLFKISTHYGTADSSGWVHTDIAAEGRELNRVAKKLDPSGRAALQRLSLGLTPGSLAGHKRDIWLCHTLCELGGTRMSDFMTTIRRFIELNPDQVIILFDEDYVAERDLQKVFKRSGLFPYLATLTPGQPLPTLGALIRAHHNVVVFAQKPPSGQYAWNADAFSWIQDTPLGAIKPGDFTCKLERGEPGNPLLMMNNWADVFPPRLSPNVPLVQRAFILARARQCVKQRGRMPNLILTDHYEQGDVVGAVATLNGVAGRKPATIYPLTRS